ncbi:hypothetical protein KOAAANKH_01948 [Brevundimonas sp. NIBR10]|uniref:hypothetical protein n=1 Tax=Brevundimonas sp. NIBR10 TaxID=3015997 RepID=UPI0022F15041|nr:hypothetical protein [Brevundimonas sp. NIBR10]WGM47074.1 hypothetical protein KOAAANKH_01948 [Brevundimonas sp. NIBR10]
MVICNLCIVGLSALALVACEKPASEPASAAVSPSATVTTPTATVPVILDGEGLKAGSTPTLVAFGSPRATVEAAVKAALGSDPVVSENPDCPTGSATVLDWGDAMQVVIQNGAFVGWRADDATARTASGLHVGSTRAEAQAGPDFSLPETTLDAVEISVDGVGGFLTSAGPDGTVEQLFAGDICMAR